MGLANALLETIDEISETYTILDLTEDFELDEELELDEGAGVLKGLPKHFIKTIAKGYDAQGGEHSGIEASGKLDHSVAFNKAVQGALKRPSGHVSVLYKNGEPIAAFHASRSYDPNGTHYNLHTPKGQHFDMQQKQYHNTGKWVHGHYVKPEYHDVKNTEYGLRDAHLRLTRMAHGSSDVKDVNQSLKSHHFEVKTFTPDKVRQEIRKKRSANAPEMQANYVKASKMEIDNPKIRGNLYGGYGGDAYKKHTSSTPAGSMKKITHAAAIKLATKKLGDKGSPFHKAQELHDQLGKHLAAGDETKAAKAASELTDHIRRSGLQSTHPDIERYADSLKRSSRRGKDDWEKRRREDMRKGNQ